eukprot:COSAG02_NODE_173_length_31245_cov_413.548096_10_plen_79_part_00
MLVGGNLRALVVTATSAGAAGAGAGAGAAAAAAAAARQRAVEHASKSDAVVPGFAVGEATFAGVAGIAAADVVADVKA